MYSQIETFHKVFQLQTIQTNRNHLKKRQTIQAVSHQQHQSCLNLSI